MSDVPNLTPDSMVLCAWQAYSVASARYAHLQVTSRRSRFRQACRFMRSRF